jgi:hypothetical protein
VAAFVRGTFGSKLMSYQRCKPLPVGPQIYRNREGGSMETMFKSGKSLPKEARVGELFVHFNPDM